MNQMNIRLLRVDYLLLQYKKNDIVCLLTHKVYYIFIRKIVLKNRLFLIEK